MRIVTSTARLLGMAVALFALSCTTFINRSVLPTVMPVVKTSVEPEYPAAASTGNVEGTAMVDMLVLKDGAVGGTRVYRSSGNDGLDSAAVKAARQFEFTPAQDAKGKPVAVWLRQPFIFKLATLYSDDKPAPETPEYMTAAVMPEIITDVPATIPDTAWKPGLEDTVRLHLWLRRDGTVAIARVHVSSGSRLLDDAAVKAALMCVYRAARNAEGEPVNIWLERDYGFSRPAH